MPNQNSVTDKYWHHGTILVELSGTGVPRVEGLSPGLEKEIPPEQHNITNSFRKNIKQKEKALLCSAVTAAELVLVCLNTLSHDKHEQELEKLQEVAKKRSEVWSSFHLGKETTPEEWCNKDLLNKTRAMWRSGKEYKDEVLPTEATQWTQSQ